MSRCCSGIIPLQTLTSGATSNLEILKPLLATVNAKEAFQISFLPIVSPCRLSINGGAFVNCDFFETTMDFSAPISSIILANPSVKYQIQIEY